MSLTEASAFLKRGFKLLLLGLAGIAILWFVILALIGAFNAISPYFAKPDIKFGSLPTPTLSIANYKQVSFVIDTVDGKLPSFPKILPVYKFTQPTARLLDGDNAKQIAASFGFSLGPTVVDKQTYQFTNPQLPLAKFIIDIVSKNFSITSNLSDPSIPKSALNLSTDAITKYARDQLKQNNLLQNDLTSSTAIVSNVKLSGASLVSASSISEANFTRVDIFRDNIGGSSGYPIVGPHAHQSLVSMLLSTGAFSPTSLIQMSYTYWPYEISSKATYPIISSSQAYTQLQQYGGSLILPTDITGSTVRIKSMGIAYFESAAFQPYLQPVVLFDGVVDSQNGSEVEVRFYLPAIDSTYLTK